MGNYSDLEAEHGAKYDFFQSIGRYFVKFYESIRGLKGSQVNEALVNQEKDEEKRAAIRDICEYVDRYDQKLQEMRASGLEPSEWLERELEASVKGAYPEVTSEEMDALKDRFVAAMDKDLELTTDIVSEEFKELKEMVEVAGEVEGEVE
ncbi:hypothetical protein IJT10_05855 [bacterium]|nr:hypothetical protein [bacterium]